MCPLFRKTELENEEELHAIIEKEIDALEEDLSVLKHEFTTAKGTLDFLWVDSGGRLCIVEVKLHEDEGILFQGLRYYSEIHRLRHFIANSFPDKKSTRRRIPAYYLWPKGFLMT